MSDPSGATAAGHQLDRTDGVTDGGARRAGRAGTASTGASRLARPSIPRFDPGAVAALACLLAVAVFIAIRLGPALVGAQTFSPADMLAARAPWWNGGPVAAIWNDNIGDPIDVLLPTYLQMHERLWSGDIPWWSSLSGPGSELLAEPSNPTLTPSAIVTLLLPTWWATGFAKFLQVLMAIAGMTLWLRRVGTAWAAGLLAGLVYVGTGFFAAWGNWAAQASVAALIPALLWLTERHVQTRTVRSALPLSIVVAFLLLGGFPASAGHAIYAAGAYLVVRLVADRTDGGWRSALSAGGLAAGALALGVGLSAVQFLPQVSGLLETNLDYRANQFYSEQPLKSLLTVLVPRALNKTGFAGSNPIEAYAYLGLGALVLAGIAIVAGRASGAARGVVTYLVLGFLLSAALVWKHGFWTDWMAGLPIFQGNSSGRLRDLVGLFGSALAGIGANVLVRADLAQRLRARATVAGVLGLLAGVAFAALIWRRYGTAVDRGTYWLDSALGLATVVLVIAALLAGRRRWTATAALVGVIALLTVQSSTSVSYFWPLSNTSDFYPENPVIEAAQAQSTDQRILTVGTFIGSTASAYGLRTVTGHAFQPQTWTDLLTALDPAAYRGAGRTVTNPTLSLSLTGNTLRNPLLDRLAANTVVAAREVQVPGPGRFPNGQPSVVRGTPGASVLSLANHVATSVPLAAGAVRAVEIYSTQHLPGGATGVDMTASISRPNGAVLATGALREQAVHPGWYQIPVAGENLAAVAGPLVLSIKVDSGSSSPTALSLAGSVGRPTIRIIGSQADGLVETFAGDQGTVWKRTTALPRIRWATATQVIPDAAQRVATLESGAVPARTVVLSAAAPAASGQDAALTTLRDTGDNVTVDTVAQGSGYLVVADWMQSGWVASIDGAPATLVQADHAFNAVLVPAGHHRVEFAFRGRGLATGLVVTAVSTVVLIGLYLWTRHRRRPVGPNGPGADDLDPGTDSPTGADAAAGSDAGTMASRGR